VLAVVSPPAGRANQTMEPIRVPDLFRWPQQEDTETLDASRIPWQAPELPLDGELILVLDGDPLPPDEFFGSGVPASIAPRGRPRAAERERSAREDAESARIPALCPPVPQIPPFRLDLSHNAAPDSPETIKTRSVSPPSSPCNPSNPRPEAP